MKIEQHKVVIIGAGPAGLACAGTLTQRGIPYVLLEKDSQVAASWRGHYDRLRLHTDKRYSHLPGMEFPPHYPTFVSRRQLIDYYETYVRRYSIVPKFLTEINCVERLEESWKIQTKDTIYTAPHVIVATGANRVPVVPDFPGRADFAGLWMHSRHYRNPLPFKNLKTLVIGMGNTGAEIALDLAEHGVDTTLCVRSPINIVPLTFNGRPTQRTGILLRKLPNFIGDTLGKFVQRRTIGDLSAFGIETPALPPSRQLRELGKTPVIDLGTVAKIRSGEITVVPGIRKIHPRRIDFDNGQAVDFDAVVVATGYRADLHRFLTLPPEYFDVHGLPKRTIGTDEANGLYFVGFDLYANGVLRSIYQESQVVAQRIEQKRSTV